MLHPANSDGQSLLLLNENTKFGNSLSAFGNFHCIYITEAAYSNYTFGE